MSDEPEINCLISISNWNVYTREAKEYGKQHEVGVYIASEFHGRTVATGSLELCEAR